MTLFDIAKPSIYTTHRKLYVFELTEIYWRILFTQQWLNKQINRVLVKFDDIYRCDVDYIKTYFQLKVD